MAQNVPGGPVIETSPSNAEGMGSIPDGGAKILYASGPKKKQNIKQKQYCNKFNNDFKNGPHQKHLLKKWFCFEKLEKELISEFVTN